jgi:hypothetical protein
VGDHRSHNSYIESRKGLPIKQLDFPLIRYAWSLKDRLNRLSIIRSKIIECNTEATCALKLTDQMGHGSNIKGIELNIYYESFLNEIYSIMENIAKINLFLFDDSSNIPPNSFNKQLNNIRKSKVSLHPKYDQLVLNEMGWYDEVHKIRSTVTHYLTGTSVCSREDDGTPRPGYLNYDLSNRNGLKSSDFKIKYNILESTEIFYDNMIELLEKISEIYIERMDKDVECHIPILFIDQTEEFKTMEIRALSYNDHIEGKKGKIIGKWPLNSNQSI